MVAQKGGFLEAFIRAFWTVASGKVILEKFSVFVKVFCVSHDEQFSRT
jgi:hypothetical protein